MRTKNPWIQKRGKGLGHFSFSRTVNLLLMSYGFYCLFNWISDVVSGMRSPKHG